MGDTIHVRGRVAALEPRCAAGTLITWDRVILNQAGKVVQQGQTQTLVEGRASLRVSIEDRETKVENQQSID